MPSLELKKSEGTPRSLTPELIEKAQDWEQLIGAGDEQLGLRFRARIVEILENDEYPADRDWFVERLEWVDLLLTEAREKRRLREMDDAHYVAMHEVIVEDDIEAHYRLAQVEEDRAAQTERLDLLGECVASRLPDDYFPEYEWVRPRHQRRQRFASRLVVSRRTGSRSRASRGCSTRTRGSRRTGTRAGPDDDSGGGEGPERGSSNHQLLLAGGWR